MLAFDVINLEQYRALQQNAARAHLPEFSGSELPLIARSSSSCKLAKLNRQIPKLERHVTCRKQTTETCSNRQKLQKRLRPISRPAGLSSERDFDTSATRKIGLPPRENEAFLRSAHTVSTRFWSKNRSYRKQTTKPFLSGATTACSETAFRSNFRISAASLGDQLRFRPEAPEPTSQCPNLSRSYGRS
jgi:hypothetical protein